jgi:hypothetical protein
MSESRLLIHPYAALFPPMTGPEFDGLCRSLARDGLEEPIVLYEGMILDGRSRHQGCLVTKVKPRFREYAGECGSPLNFVVAKNLHRRHLTEGQRAVVAAKLKPLFEEEARQRQRAGLKQGGQPPVPLNLTARGKPDVKGESAQKAGALMKVSQSSVQFADKVMKRGVPQLVDALAAGKVSVSAAAGIAKLPAEQQQAVVAGIERGLKPKQAIAEVKARFDDDGRPLSEAVIPAFRQREELRALCRRIKALGRALEHLSGSPVSLCLDVQRVLSSLEAIRQELWAAQPARMCAHGPGNESACDQCQGRGWLPVTLRKNTAA